MGSLYTLPLYHERRGVAESVPVEYSELGSSPETPSEGVVRYQSSLQLQKIGLFSKG